MDGMSFIQIDVAGWGKLVGGVTVGVYRTGTQEFAAEVIPPQFFHPDAFAAQAYLDEAVMAVRKCFRRLVVQHSERIEVYDAPDDKGDSRGFVLSKVRDRLSEAGYDWRPIKIESALQDRVEREFWFHWRDLGLRVKYDKYIDPDPRARGWLWWKQVGWLKGGDAKATSPDPERAEWCKTGWSSYEIWANHPYQEAKRIRKGGSE